MIDAFGILKIRLLGGQNELKFYAKTLFIINQVLLLSFLLFCLCICSAYILYFACLNLGAALRRCVVEVLQEM